MYEINWEDVHDILVSLVSQRTIADANEAGMDALRFLLHDSSYRIYINQSIRGSSDMQLAYENDVYNYPIKNNEIAQKIETIEAKQIYLLEEGSNCYFSVFHRNNFYVFVVLHQDEKILTPDQREFLVTLVEVWSNLLGTLFSMQRDALTGLFTRSLFNDAIRSSGGDNAWFKNIHASHVAPERRDEESQVESAAIALIDIDHFKRINDTWGHMIGDEVLLKLANVMNETLRTHDFICRYGGEEFAVLLRHVDGDAAHEILERLRTVITETPFPKVGQLTVSIGHAMNRPDHPPSQILEHADRALYYAKENGRNQVVDADKVFEYESEQESIEVGEIELF